MVLTDLDVTTISLNSSLRCAALTNVRFLIRTMRTTSSAMIVLNVVLAWPTEHSLDGWQMNGLFMPVETSPAAAPHLRWAWRSRATSARLPQAGHLYRHEESVLLPPIKAMFGRPAAQDLELASRAKVYFVVRSGRRTSGRTAHLRLVFNTIVVTSRSVSTI